VKKPKKQYRSSEGGSFMIDREIKGIGRIHRASGLTVEAQYNLVNDAIPELAKSKKGRALLAAFKDLTINGVQLFVAIKSNDLDSFTPGDAGKPLAEALDRWNADTEKAVAKATHTGRAVMIREIAKYAKPSSKIVDLPKVLRAMKAGMKSAHSFNQNLQYASAFVRDTLGRRHEVYLDVRDIDVRKTTAKTERNPLTPAEVLALATAFDRVWKSKKGSRGAEVVGMALTGMGPTEYWGKWNVLSDRVHVDGPKRSARVRDLPKLFPCAIYPSATIARPAITASSFARALNIASIATGIECSPYDLRRTFGNWLEAAQVLRSRRKQYLGHAIGDVTERYERHEVTQHLLADGEKVRAWIAASIESATSRPPEQTANIS
jgi:integrase